MRETPPRSGEDDMEQAQAEIDKETPPRSGEDTYFILALKALFWCF